MEPGAVLLVEDHAVLREAVADLLATQGYRVLVAPEGVTALKLFLRHQPEVVLSDWTMPQTDVDGLELLRRIRGEGNLVAPHFILMTARGETADRVRGLDTGADDYLVKPFDERELLARVAAGMRRIVQWQQSAGVHQRSIAESREMWGATLPDPTQTFRGIRWGYRVAPCDYLGGDGLDLFERPDGELVAVHYDVSGHGVPAAIASVGIHNLLRSPGFWHELEQTSPTALVSVLDRDLPYTCTGKMFTMFCAMFDAPRSRLRYTRAGHSPALLLRGGQVHFLRTGGALIGLDLGLPWETGVLEVMEGDRIFIYSDGIVDAADRHRERFGTRRLARVALDTASLPIPQALEKIETALTIFSGGSSFADDVSMVAVDVGRR